MPINTSLLVAAPVLQDVLVDTAGQPMAAGTVTCYQDTSRTTLKDWFYQTGSPGSYEYIALPNPLTLSAAGTICDDNGVDTLPFFYPYDEEDFTIEQAYYIVIENYAQTNQITRANFPFMGNSSQSVNPGLSQDNYIANNVFWRNGGNINLSSETNLVVCPSQHDGFRMPDIRFIKNNTLATEALIFQKFPLSDTPTLINDPTPEYYADHTCTVAGSSETFKYYQFPISYHVNTLNGQNCTITIQARNLGSSESAASTMRLYILQDLGTGVVSPDPILISSISPGPSWQKYEISITLPGTLGLTLSSAADDALYLLVGMPLNSICQLNFTKPSLYLLANTSPTNSFQTYDQIDPIINGARTGDVRFSLNAFAPFGWVTANDGTIGSATSSATTRANIDTWPLYNLIWSSVSDTYAPVSGGRGVSAYADFAANKAMALTKALRRVLGGAGSAGSGLTARALGETLGVESFVMATDQMPAHTHSTALFFVNINEGLGSSTSVVIPLESVNPVVPEKVTTSAGGSTAISIMQPSVFYNIFFKL